MHLHVEKVGPNDNSFKLAVNMIERLREKGFRTDVRALFTTQTLMDLAGVIENSASKSTIEVLTNKPFFTFGKLVDSSDRNEYEAKI